jgi:hypothetical protein
MRKGGRTRARAGSAAAVLLVLASCGGAAPAGRAVRSARCAAAAIHHGPPPAWTAGAWAGSSPGSSPPYALATGDRAAAFFADPLRAGHPTDPANKVLWVVRQPRQGMPLTVSARRVGTRSSALRISRPADSGPGEIYPSYVDLPQAGCWRLALAWGSHRAAIDVQVAPARAASVRGSGAAAARRPPGRPRAAVPRPLHGIPLTGRTGLRLLVAGDPPFVLNVDSGRSTPVTGVNIRDDPVLTAEAVGRDAVLWADGRSGRKPPVIYLVRHGTTRAIRIGTGSAVAPADHGDGLWLIRTRGVHRCVLTEVSLSGETLRPPRRTACGSRLLAVGASAAVLVRGRRVIAPDTGRTLLRAQWLWAIAGGQALTSVGSGPPLRLIALEGGAIRSLRWPSRIGLTDEAVTAPGGRLLAVDFADPAYRLGSTQVTDGWLLDPVSGRFRHLPDMPAAVHLKFTSMAWAPDRRLVMIAGPDGPGAGRGLVVIWRPGQRHLALRSIYLRARNSGSDTFVVR